MNHDAHGHGHAQIICWKMVRETALSPWPSPPPWSLRSPGSPRWCWWWSPHHACLTATDADDTDDGRDTLDQQKHDQHNFLRLTLNSNYTLGAFKNFYQRVFQNLGPPFPLCQHFQTRIRHSILLIFWRNTWTIGTVLKDHTCVYIQKCSFWRLFFYSEFSQGFRKNWN